MSEGTYKIIRDITQEVKEVKEKIFGFPENIKIKEARLLIGPDEWDGYGYFIKLVYVINGVEYSKTVQIYHSFIGALYKLLNNLKDFYNRMYSIQ